MTKSHKMTAANTNDSPAPAHDGAATAGAAGSAVRPGSSLRIRRASAADAPAMAQIGVRSWQAAYRGILPNDFLAGLSVAARETAWRMVLWYETNDEAAAWVAERDGQPIGFLHSGPPRDGDVPLPAAEVYALYVLPEAWRGGAGRALLTTAVDHWWKESATTLVLWVLERNARGRAFYEAMGWFPDGARQQFEIGGFSASEVRYRVGHSA